MRTFQQIMHNAGTLPGNALIVTREEAEICIDHLVNELHLDGIARDVARAELHKGHMSLFGKQIVVSR